MRAFFCVPIEQRPKEAMGTTAEALRGRTKMRASWVHPDNYHLTVRFLGEIDPMQTVDLERICRQALCDLRPFEIALEQVGAFPSVDRPRVLWIGGETPNAYGELVNAVNRDLEMLGFQPDRKRPVAHVTIARIKGRPDPELGRVMGEMNPLPPLATRVDRVTLMESRLTPRGAEYTPLFEVLLEDDG